MIRRMLAAGTEKQILIVDRDDTAMEGLREKLQSAGFAVRPIAGASAALNQVHEQPPHLVIIDWNTSGFAAREVIERVRSVRLPHPVRLIILSSLCGEHDVVAGLNLGADDYIAKPFSVREVVARVCAVLRTQEHRESPKPRTGPAPLTSQRGAEYRLLEIFRSHPGRTFNRAELLAQAWSADRGIDERTVDVNVQRLRKILATPGCECRIQTVRGFGYRFVNAAEEKKLN
jgi:two-component system, OmpR family, phosphate regulon response regulator PhoB